MVESLKWRSGCEGVWRVRNALRLVLVSGMDPMLDCLSSPSAVLSVGPSPTNRGRVAARCNCHPPLG